MEYQSKRKKCFTEIHQEKERLAEEEERLKQQMEETKQNLLKENSRIIERLKQEHNEVLESINKRYQVSNIFLVIILALWKLTK